jgi:hypothetical protein
MAKYPPKYSSSLLDVNTPLLKGIWNPSPTRHMLSINAFGSEQMPKQTAPYQSIV